MTETEITVVERSERAREHAVGWGADRTIAPRDDGSYIGEIQELTGGGAQVVIDFVGKGGAQNEAVKMLGHNGTDLLVGYGGTLVVEILEEALFPETSFVGNILGTCNEMVELVHMVRRGAVTLTATTFPLEGVSDALHALDEGRMIGRGVLVPNARPEPARPRSRRHPSIARGRPRLVPGAATTAVRAGPAAGSPRRRAAAPRR